MNNAQSLETSQSDSLRMMDTSLAPSKLNSEAGVLDGHSHQSHLEPVPFKVVVLCGYGEKRTNISLLKESETEGRNATILPHLMGLYGCHGGNWIEDEVIVTEAGHFLRALWTKPAWSPYIFCMLFFFFPDHSDQDTWTHMDYMTCF